MKSESNKEAAKWQLVFLLLLFLSVVFVAIVVVMHRHKARALFVESQKLEKQHNILIAHWSRLKLEQGVVLNEIYVERKARQDLGMSIPKAKDIRVVSE